MTAYAHATSKNHTDIANRILTYKALKDLQKTDNITHILNRHTILGKNKNVTVVDGQDQDLQNSPYRSIHSDNSVASFFPRSWNKRKIQEAIESVLKKPEQLDVQPAQLTEDNQVLRSALILRGTYAGIPIKVVISQTNDTHAPWKVFTAYPELQQ